MTISTSPAASGAQVQVTEDLITVTIDGFEVAVPKGTLVIRAAELIGIQIPRFCDHPLLEPVGACRQCLVEVEGQRKPIASCTTTVTDGMVVKTQLTSPVADKAQQGVMELLLINHPLDCPICDKGGECPLQNQAMSNGRAESRFRDNKRTYPKPINISSQVLLDRERCVLCARCTRFSQQIAGDPFIELLERGALQQVGIYEKEPFESYFSGNTVQICPVGALTGAAYRFRARPFDLVSTPTVCEHCASGCALRTDWRRGKVMRRLAGDDPEVNEEWNCDKGRWAFQYATAQDRLTVPLVREDDGTLVPTSWADALDVAARGLAAARGSVGVLVGGRATLEDAYGYAKFARVALGTNDIDMRARPYSEEEADFLARYVAGQPMGPTYDDLERASTVLLVGFEPEEESPIVFLRLRKAVRRHGMNVLAVAPYASWGLQKLSGRLLPTLPGAEPTALEALRSGTDELAELVRGSGTVILVGERMATVRGALSAVASLADAVGATVGWVPRR
ncbi:MAG TPA: NADH-quinone oxidoreductase subunit G, partial [Acidothermales bacterium]